jgi:hypothetical protein
VNIFNWHHCCDCKLNIMVINTNIWRNNLAEWNVMRIMYWELITYLTDYMWNYLMGTLLWNVHRTVILHIWTSSGAHPFFFCRGEIARQS